ncbi:MAG: DUF885 family protein [Candidatus Melainabacteria bacterium]|nr:DUF885 family protein [Candidatus Melainabacteria bacterium]
MRTERTPLAAASSFPVEASSIETTHTDAHASLLAVVPFSASPMAGLSARTLETPVITDFPGRALAVVLPSSPAGELSAADVSAVFPAEAPSVAAPPVLVSQAPSANSRAEQFEADVQEVYGVSSEQISQFTRAEFDRQLTEINALAQRIRPGAQHWTDALANVEQTRLQTPEQVMALYNQAVDQSLAYIQEQGLLSPLRRRPSVEEDAQRTGSGAYAQPGRIVVETRNPGSDEYLPASAPNTAIHELLHIWDFEVNGSAGNPHSEGLAFFLESHALARGDFYQSPEAELLARKWQLLRQARAFLTVELQAGRMTSQEAKLFLMENLRHNEANSNFEVLSMTRNPLERMSYAVGAAQIDQLWEQVQQSNPNVSFREFMDDLVALGGEDSGSIVDYARERYGITLQGLSSPTD